MNQIINVGDEIKNCRDDAVKVTKVTKGKHGLLLQGMFVGEDISFHTFCPYELPAQGETDYWYNWYAREFVILPCNIQLGCVSYARGTLHADKIANYDAEWERTIEEMREEELVEL